MARSRVPASEYSTREASFLNLWVLKLWISTTAGVLDATKFDAVVVISIKDMHHTTGFRYIHLPTDSVHKVAISRKIPRVDGAWIYILPEDLS